MSIYILEKSQNSPTKINYSRLTWRTKEIKNDIYQLDIKCISDCPKSLPKKYFKCIILSPKICSMISLTFTNEETGSDSLRNLSKVT